MRTAGPLTTATAFDQGRAISKFTRLVTKGPVTDAQHSESSVKYLPSPDEIFKFVAQRLAQSVSA